MLLLLIAGSLVARSASDIWMIQSVTMIETTIIQMDRRRFLKTLMKYCAALPLVRITMKQTFYSAIDWSAGAFKSKSRMD